MIYSEWLPFLTISNTSPFQTLHDFIHYFAFWLFLFFIHSFFTLSLTLSHHFLVVFKSFSIFSFSILIFNLHNLEYFFDSKKGRFYPARNTFPFFYISILGILILTQKNSKKRRWEYFSISNISQKTKKGGGVRFEPRISKSSIKPTIPLPTNHIGLIWRILIHKFKYP